MTPEELLANDLSIDDYILLVDSNPNLLDKSQGDQKADRNTQNSGIMTEIIEGYQHPYTRGSLSGLAGILQLGLGGSLAVTPELLSKAGAAALIPLGLNNIEESYNYFTHEDVTDGYLEEALKGQFGDEFGEKAIDVANLVSPSGVLLHVNKAPKYIKRMGTYGPITLSTPRIFDKKPNNAPQTTEPKLDTMTMTGLLAELGLLTDTLLIDQANKNKDERSDSITP